MSVATQLSRIETDRNTIRAKLVELGIELIRQFYDLPRQFRIVGQYGAEQYITYTNAKLVAQQQTGIGDMGMRLPLFDIKVSAQRRNVYTKVSQNELALQFFKMGFFNPQAVDSTLMCLEMMDFDGRDDIMQKVAQMGTMYQKMMAFAQMAMQAAAYAPPEMQQYIAHHINGALGGGGGAPMVSAPTKIMQADSTGGIHRKEHGIVSNARERSNQASQPDSGKVVATK